MSQMAAVELLDIMQGSESSLKIEALHTMKQSIKKESIEVPAVKPLFQSLKLGLTSANSQVSGQALTTTHGALRRLDIQDPSLLKTALPVILTLLIDRFGDPVDKIAQLARDCLSIAWRSAAVEVEGSIKSIGFTHRIARVRENSVRWTAKMALEKNPKMAFRSFSSLLIAALEDADASVRDASKQVIVDLYLTVPPHARADLRREMNMQNIRRSTMQHILQQLEIPDGPEINLGKSTGSLNEDAHSRSTKRIVSTSSHNEGSIAGSIASTYLGSLPGSEMEVMEAVNIHSARDLEHEMNAMMPCFEGRESERNWLNREKNINRLRAILRGNSLKEHNAVLITGIKTLLEGVIKGMTSLRTSLCLIGLQFAKDLCIILGPGADQFVEQLLATLMKLTGATKKIQAQAANMTINVLLASVSYHSRLLQHISFAVQDKNVAPRLYATSWLKVLLDTHLNSKSQIEHSGIDILDRSIRKGLADANPGVRDGMRSTYWKYAAIWPEKASSILQSLDGTAKKQLEKANPVSEMTLDNERVSETRPTHTRTASSNRPPIKTLVQMERARAALPSIDSISLPRPANTTNGTIDQRPELKHSSLSSGPQRQGLGGAVRPVPQVRKPSTSRQDDPLRSSVKSVSSNNAAGNPPSNSSPSRIETAFSPRRRKPITEQLESENWRIRVEGVITLACLLANKEPPNTDGQKIVLPSSDTLAPLLRKLMADSQAEVVDHLMAPEVIAEIAKIIEWEAILPRVLLLSETDQSETGHDVKSDCLPAVKAMFDDHAAVQQCLDTLALLKVAGHLVKPIKPNFRFTTAQKRPIIKAVLLWLIELIEKHQEAVDKGEKGNPAFYENTEYRLVMNRTMSMMTNIQPSSINYSPLATFLKALRKSDVVTFDKNLSTFERPVISALKKAWGEKPVEEEEVIDEPVADVESVLGLRPPVEAQQLERIDSQSTDSSPARSNSSPSTPRHPVAADVSLCDSSSPRVNDDENLTMIPSQIPFAPKTPAGFRQALHMVDSPWSNDGSPLPKEDKSMLTPRDKSEAHENPEWPLSAPTTVLPETSPTGSKKFSGPDHWFRKQMKAQALNTPLPRAFEEKCKLLHTCISRLGQLHLDSLGFRKLIKIAREHPTPASVSDGELDTAVDVWDSGTTFDAMMDSLLKYLDSDSGAPSAELKIQGILLLKTTMRSQPQYFAGHEDQAIQTLISLRSLTDSQMLSSGLDEFIPELIIAVEPTKATLSVLQCLQSYVSESEPSWQAERLPSLLLALSSLAISVALLTVPQLEGFAQALAQLVVKAMNDEFDAPNIEVAEVRRSTVNLCMSMYSIIGDTRVVLGLLRNLKPNQQNLLTYYFANREQH